MYLYWGPQNMMIDSLLCWNNIHYFTSDLDFSKLWCHIKDMNCAELVHSTQRIVAGIHKSPVQCKQKLDKGSFSYIHRLVQHKGHLCDQN